MTIRQRIRGVLSFAETDRLPIVHFGFLGSTLRKWAAEVRYDTEVLPHIWDNSPDENRLAAMLGFDANYHSVFCPNSGLAPAFESRVLEELPGGYLPCPDHRLASDAKWENVQYYCERMRTAFGG